MLDQIWFLYQNRYYFCNISAKYIYNMDSDLIPPAENTSISVGSDKF